MAMPRNLIEIDWFRDAATLNPVSYLIEGVRSLIIIGWDAGGARARLRRRRAIAVVALALAVGGPADEAGALVRTLVRRPRRRLARCSTTSSRTRRC